jgi:hypothetical protein
VESDGRGENSKHKEKIAIAPNEDECVRIERFNIPMTNAKLKCLEPETGLDDQVINFHFGLLPQRDAFKGTVEGRNSSTPYKRNGSALQIAGTYVKTWRDGRIRMSSEIGIRSWWRP